MTSVGFRITRILTDYPQTLYGHCFRVQLVTCCDFLVFLYLFEAHSIDFSSMIGVFFWSLELQIVVYRTQLVHYIFGHKLKATSVAKKEYNHLEQNKANEGTQEITPIRGLPFQVITKLLRVPIRPLTHQTLSKSLRTSSYATSGVFLKSVRVRCHSKAYHSQEGPHETW